MCVLEGSGCRDARKGSKTSRTCICTPWPLGTVLDEKQWEQIGIMGYRFVVNLTLTLTALFGSNPFPCGSLWNAHHAAWGLKSPDKIGLFGPVLPVKNTSPHSCRPIGENPFGALLIWACKLLRKLLSHTLPPPPDILCCYTEPWQKLGAVLAFT
jgi:hypothetical protein